MATSNCTSDDEGDRCYTATDLDSDTLYHFRVFAMNDFGTSGISVDETIASGETLAIDPPARVTSITATDYHADKIVVSWSEVTDTGGADVLWYCLAIASSPSGDFIDLANTEEDDEMDACELAVEATAAAVADNDGVYASPVNIDSLVDTTEDDIPVAIVVAATDDDGDAETSYEHLGLGGELPDSFELRYRLYAVTSESGKASDTGDRRISRAASQTATGKTITPPDKPDKRDPRLLELSGTCARWRTPLTPNWRLTRL